MGNGSNTAAVLADLAARINAAHARVGASMTEGMRSATEAGKLLLEAKSTAPHGQWLPWLKANCKFSERTAQAYMQVARRMASADEAEAQRVADMSFREALAAVGESGSRAKPKKLSAMQRIGKLPAKEQAWLYHLMAAWTELKPDEQLKALSWIRDTDSGLTDDGRDRVNGMIDRRRTALQ
jgi:hypothetical protein